MYIFDKNNCARCVFPTVHPTILCTFPLAFQKNFVLFLFEAFIIDYYNLIDNVSLIDVMSLSLSDLLDA